MDMYELLEAIGATDEGWDVADDFGLDSLLECPCGFTIEQDGRCPNGHVSPLRAAGLI